MKREHITTVFVVLSVLAFDQLTKFLAKVFLEPHRSVSVLGDFFRLTYVENPGMAFGIQIANKLIFNLLSIIAVLFIFYYLFRMRDNKLLRISFAMILGGAFGNLLDRFLRGRVIDFLDFEFFNIHLDGGKFLFFEIPRYSMDRWPVFNMADMAVSIGMILIIIVSLFDGKSSRKIRDVSPEEL